MTLFLILAANFAIGICIGLTGIAGFLLPMFYSGFLGMGSAVSLAYSFSAFLISGILGSVNYKKSGNLDLKTGVYLSAGSFLGALLGVRLNLLIPEHIIKLILYLVVLGSGISILVRTRSTSKSAPAAGSSQKPPLQMLPCILLGLSTGSVCAASGAGGPVLVMPLLTSLGFPAHTAIGIALFDSIFIALPAAFGYLRAASGTTDTAMFLLLLLAHGIGVMIGSKNAVKINQNLMKKTVAAASIIIACLKLAGI